MRSTNSLIVLTAIPVLVSAISAAFAYQPDAQDSPRLMRIHALKAALNSGDPEQISDFVAENCAFGSDGEAKKAVESLIELQKDMGEVEATDAQRLSMTEALVHFQQVGGDKKCYIRFEFEDEDWLIIKIEIE